MAPPMYNSMRYDYIPYKGSIGRNTRRYSPYQGTITGKQMNSGRLYKGTIEPQVYDRKEKKTPTDRHKARVPSRRRASRPAKEVKRKKYSSTVRERASLRTRPKNTDSLYKGNIKWQAQQKPYKGYQFKPYKGTIEVFSGPYKEYRLPDDYYGFRRRRNKVHPLRHVPPNQYQPASEREVEFKENRYVPGYAVSQSYDRQVVDNTLRYKPDYASAKQEDKQIIHNESRYIPTYAGIVHRQKEIVRPSSYQQQTESNVTEDRTTYKPPQNTSKAHEKKYVTESRAPAYAPIFVAMHTAEKTVEGPSKTPPEIVYSRQSPVVNDPLRENPSKINPMTSAVPVVVTSYNSNSQNKDKKLGKESKKEKNGPPEKQDTFENSVGQRKLSPKKESPVVVAQQSSKDKDKRKRLEPSEQRNLPAVVPKANRNKEPVVVSAASAAAANKRKPSESQRRASPLVDPISLFPPPSPEPLLPGRVGNSPRRISPDAMRYEPSYKPKPEPMFPPLIPVSAQDYINSKPSPQPKVLSKGGHGHPLIPTMIPFNDGKSPYYNFSPPVFGDIFYGPSSPTSPIPDYTPNYTGIPSYTAVGSVLRSMQVYNY